MPWTYCTRSASLSLYLTIVHRTKVTGYVSLSKPNYPLLVRNITSKDMSKLDQRGNESILSRWFAPMTNCSPCLPSNSTFQRAGTSRSPLWQTQQHIAPSLHKKDSCFSLSWPNTAGDFKSSSLDVFLLLQIVPCCSFCISPAFPMSILKCGYQS